MPRFVWLALVSLAVIVSCSSGGAKAPPGDGGAGGDPDGGPTGSGGATGTGGRTGTGGNGFSCSDFGFRASGVSCPTSGCSLSCSCPDDFPKTIASCTGDDGCLVSANCSTVCKYGLGRALECADTYTVLPPSSGGAGGGSGGSGTGGAPPTCAATDVQVPVASALELGSIPLNHPRILGDESGSLYVVATVERNGDVDVGGGTLPSNGTHLVLFRLNAAHEHVWSRRFGSELSIERASAFRFARNGDLLVAGFTGRKVNLGGGMAPEVTPPQLFVARYDRAGTFVRGYLVTAPSDGDVPVPSSVAETPAGDILLFGSFAKPWNIAGGTLTPAGDKDVFILRFAAAGTLTDAKRFGRGGSDDFFDAVVADDGSVFVLGFAHVAIDLGKDPIDLGTDQSSSYVTRLDASLVPVWQKRLSGVSAYPRRAFLSGTTLVVAGDTYGDVWYADKTAGMLPRGHVFVLRIDTATGDLLQGKTYAETGFGARVTAFAAMPDNGVALGGNVSPPADFGGGALTAISGYQPFLVRFDGAGEHVTSTLFCTTRPTGGADGAIGGIARDGDSIVLVAPYMKDMELGSTRFAGEYGSLLMNMPAD